MSMQDIAAALQRVDAVLRRRPEAGLHEDSPATACWEGGLRVVTHHANGTQVAADMPAEFGGSGELVTPGWLFRAGLAACAVDSIVLLAATEDLTLTALEVRASSRSDTRGLMGIADAEGHAVSAGPGDVRLHVRVAAPGLAPERLLALVERGVQRSPIGKAVTQATAVALHIELADG